MLGKYNPYFCHLDLTGKVFLCEFSFLGVFFLSERGGGMTVNMMEKTLWEVTFLRGGDRCLWI